METKANHFIIGLFVVGLILAGFGFLRWTVNQDMGSSSASYQVLFEGSVAGLAPGSNVLFNGIKVGKVESISIHAADSRKVEVMLRLRPGVPVRTVSQASITSVGITGLSAVQISAGEPAAPLLVASNGSEPMRIKAKPAMSGSLMDAMPEILGNVNALFVRLNELVASNEVILRKSMTSIQGFAGVLDDNKDEFGTAMKNVRLISESFRNSAARLDTIIAKVDGDLLTGDKSIVVQAKDAMAALRGVAHKLDRTIGGNADQIAVVAKRSLQEFELLAKDGRRTVRSLDRILQRVDKNPQSLLFGDTTVRAYKPQ